MSKQKIVSFLFEKNYMVSPEILKKIPDSFDYDSFLQSHKNFQKSQTTILLTEEMFQNFFPPPQTVYSPFSTKIEIVDSYVDKPKKRINNFNFCRKRGIYCLWWRKKNFFFKEQNYK